jgi:hypothetical protein
LFFAAGNTSNDSIVTTGIGVQNTILKDWPDGQTLAITDVDSANAAIIISTPSSVAQNFLDLTTIYETPSGNLSLVKNNYFIADGNIYVSE